MTPSQSQKGAGASTCCKAMCYLRGAVLSTRYNGRFSLLLSYVSQPFKHSFPNLWIDIHINSIFSFPVFPQLTFTSDECKCMDTSHALLWGWSAVPALFYSPVKYIHVFLRFLQWALIISTLNNPIWSANSATSLFTTFCRKRFSIYSSLWGSNKIAARNHQLPNGSKRAHKLTPFLPHSHCLLDISTSCGMLKSNTG